MIHRIASLVGCLACAMTGLAGAEGLPAGWRAQAVFLTDHRLETLKARIAANREPTASAFRRVRTAADEALNASPPLIQATFRSYSPYKEAEQAAKAAKATTWGRDVNAVYHLALIHRITGKAVYAKAAVALVNAWDSGITEISPASNTPLTVSSGFPAFIAAADLLRASPEFPAADQERFARFLRELVLPRHSMKRSNNWGSWGTLLALTGGAYLNDRTWFGKGVARWKELIDSQQAADGTLTEEVTRSEGRMGLWYSNFTLLPATCAAEVARINGVDLFAYASPTGKSLRTAHLKLIPWLQNPAGFPYYHGDVKDLVGVLHVPHLEILTLRYPEPAVRTFFLAHRPVTTHYCMPDLDLTHADLLDDRE